MTAAEVVKNFRAELEQNPEWEPVLVMFEGLLSQAPAVVVGTLDALVIPYCRARGAALELPEVTA